jgi:hypothetical protein
MTNAFWEGLSAESTCPVGSLGLTRNVTPLLERQSIALADGSSYMPRPLNRKPPDEALLSFEAPAGAAVLVTNVLGDYEPFRIIRAEANGRAIEPVAKNDFSSLYAPQASDGNVVHWTLEIVATNARAVEAVAIEFGAQASPSGAPLDCEAARK